MPYILIETNDPDRTCILPLDSEGPAVTVREVCRGSTLADVANEIDRVEVETVKARHAAIIAGLRARIAVAAVTTRPLFVEVK